MSEPSEPTETVEIVDGETVWRFDTEFLTSDWTCIWGRGCQGILTEPSEHLQQGCCSIGVHLGDADEARLVAANTALLEPALFQHHAEAAEGGVFSDDTHTNTRVVEGACIFLNRPGFAGGAGCALHLAAVEADESPLDWKPQTCWQLPVKIDWTPRPDGTELAEVRRWSRADWGDEGADMAWWCTEQPEAHVGDQPVIDSLAEELDELVGTEVMVELRRRLS